MIYSLIIPCYNEAKNLPALIERCKNLSQNPSTEVIFVDNGSTDETPLILNELLSGNPQFSSIRVEVNQGYGFGILSGLKAARGDILGWTHADLQTDPQDILKAIELFQQYGHDIFVKGQRHGRPIADVIFTIGMSFFESILLKKSFWDINAQPNLFPRTFYESWVNPPHDFSLDLFVYYQARQMNLSIYRFPVYFGERLHGVSHWNVNWKAKFKFIKRTIDFSLTLRKALN